MNWKFSGDRPVYQQIMENIRGAVLRGELPPGGRVPSVRELAMQAQVNPNTMQRALTELEREGLLIGGGTRGRAVAKAEKGLEAVRPRAEGGKGGEGFGGNSAAGSGGPGVGGSGEIQGVWHYPCPGGGDHASCEGRGEVIWKTRY